MPEDWRMYYNDTVMWHKDMGPCYVEVDLHPEDENHGMEDQRVTLTCLDPPSLGRTMAVDITQPPSATNMFNAITIKDPKELDKLSVWWPPSRTVSRKEVLGKKDTPVLILAGYFNRKSTRSMKKSCCGKTFFIKWFYNELDTNIYTKIIRPTNIKFLIDIYTAEKEYMAVDEALWHCRNSERDTGVQFHSAPVSDQLLIHYNRNVPYLIYRGNKVGAFNRHGRCRLIDNPTEKRAEYFANLFMSVDIELDV